MFDSKTIAIILDLLRRQHPDFDFDFEEFSNMVLVRCKRKGYKRIEDYSADKTTIKSVYTLLTIARKLVNRFNEDPHCYVATKNDVIATIDTFNHMNGIKNVIFSEPATIVFFNDGTKEVVKCSDDDEYNPAAGIAFCVMKRYFGKDYHHELKKWMKKYDAEKEAWNDYSKNVADKLVDLFKKSKLVVVNGVPIEDIDKLPSPKEDENGGSEQNS